jgi:hypothetical protein
MTWTELLSCFTALATLSLTLESGGWVLLVECHQPTDELADKDSVVTVKQDQVCLAVGIFGHPIVQVGGQGQATLSEPLHSGGISWFMQEVAE